MTTVPPAPGGEISVFQAPDGAVRVDVRLERDTVWLTQQQMAELFGRDRSVVTKHVRNVFGESELEEKSNVQNLHIAGSDRPVGYYSLDVIISVGYRVKSARGTQFRIWATKVLRDHLVRGYTVNAARLRDLNRAVRLIADTARRRELTGDEAQALLAVVANYNRALELTLVSAREEPRLRRRQQAHRGGAVPVVPGTQRRAAPRRWHAARLRRCARRTDADDRREPAAGEGHAGAHRDAPAGRRDDAMMTTNTSERGHP